MECPSPSSGHVSGGTGLELSSSEAGDHSDGLEQAMAEFWFSFRSEFLEMPRSTGSTGQRHCRADAASTAAARQREGSLQVALHSRRARLASQHPERNGAGGSRT